MPESQLNSYTITSFFILISSQRKNTPPQDAVIIPTGISIGEKMVRDKVSAAVRNEAPRRKEHGRMIRLSTPIIILSTWGIISPTNPIGPVTEITALTASDVAK